MANYGEMVAKTTSALSKRIVANGGRWCEVALKKTGDVVRVVRVGYGPMERPEWDNYVLVVNGEQMFGVEFANLTQVAAWMCDK